MSEIDAVRIFKLRNPILEYAWGSKTFISHLQGRDEASIEPQAELWMGAHPIAPSRIKINSSERSLLEMINDDPYKMLGKKIADRFNNRLPFLFKVLAAASPLSIQAHPSKTQAAKGFKLENKRNIFPNSPERTYKDDNHKPELICALTNFDAMCGFQPIKEIVERIKYLQLEDNIPIIKELDTDPSPRNLKRMFLELMSKHDDDQTKKISVLINRLIEFEPRDDHEAIIFRWVTKLAAIYPADMGVFSPLFLNVVKLKEGEALFIEAGVLHAYLNGSGVEIMASSDNVLRGGLTSKKVDLPELVKILNFDHIGLKKIEPEIGKNENVYQTSAKEFQLSKIVIREDESYVNAKISSAEIFLCTEGKGSIKWSQFSLELRSGESVFIPFAISEYSIEGSMELFRAVVPTH